MPSAPRGIAVVEAVFDATFQELSRVGYAALSIEDVASRAGVNRTTIYRRWPTKSDLVFEAFRSMKTDDPAPDTGNIHDDLVELGMRIVRVADSVRGRAMTRIFLFEGKLPELKELGAKMKARRSEIGLPSIIHRAMARGELPLGFDADLLMETFHFTLLCKTVTADTPPQRATVRKLVDVLVRGLLPAPSPSAAPAPARARARAQRRR